MKAVGIWAYGGPEVLEVIDVVTPEPKSDEVKVKVFAATVNPTDMLLRSGAQSATMEELHPPYIPGMELAGHIHSVGAQVSHLRPGDPVIGIVNPRRQEGGAMNQLVVVSADSVVAIANDTDLISAATLPMNGLTALKAVQLMDLEPGSKILVTGAAGAVGSYAVQIAKYFGLFVVADAHPADHEYLRELGVDQLVDRGEAMGEGVSRWAPGGVDGVIDAAILGQKAWDTAAAGAPCIALRGQPTEPDSRVKHIPLSVTHYFHDTAGLQLVVDLFTSGTISTRVSKVLPMAAAVDAHRQLTNGGLRGRIVLTFAD